MRTKNCLLRYRIMSSPLYLLLQQAGGRHSFLWVAIRVAIWISSTGLLRPIHDLFPILSSMSGGIAFGRDIATMLTDMSGFLPV